MVDDAETDIWRVEPGRSARRRHRRRAGPVQRRAVPGGRRWSPAARSPSRTGPRVPPRPATRCAGSCRRMGAACELTTSGLTVTGTGRCHGHRRRPARRRRADPGARRGRGAGRVAVHAARDRAPAPPRDRPAGRAQPRELNALGGDVAETDGRARRSGRARCTAACSTPTTTTGWPPPPPCSACASPASRSRTSRRPPRRCPTSPTVDAGCSGERRRDARAVGKTSTRTTSGSARPAGLPAPDQGPPDPRGRGRRDRGRPSTAAATPACRCDGARSVVTAMKARELGRKASSSATGSRLVGDVSGGPDSLARDRPGGAAARRSCGGRPTTPTRSSGSSSRTPTSSSIVTALADPEPRPRLIDRCLVAAYDAGLDAAAVPDQVRPRVAGRAARDLPAPWTSAHVVARRDELARRAPRRGSRDRTSVLVGHSGVGQVHAGQRPGARRRPGHRRVNASPAAGGTPRRRRSRCGCRAAAGSSTPPASAASGSPTSTVDRVIRAFPDLGRGTEECPRGCTPRRAGVRAGRLGRRRPRRPGPAGLAAPPAAQPGRGGRRAGSRLANRRHRSRSCSSTRPRSRGGRRG